MDRREQVLLFHLTNHYALIFGLREWRSTNRPPEVATSPCPPGNLGGDQAAREKCAAAATAGGDCARPVGRADDTHGGCGGGSTATGEGRWTRQILTARKGQRPTVWMNFEEARRILLGWEGYKVLALSRGRARPLA